MGAEWVDWHRHYDNPGSSLARRLGVVQAAIGRALREAPQDSGGSRRLVSICAGAGRDVLPVLARHGGSTRALLVELDPTLAQRARDTVAELGLADVTVRTADAGATDTYRGVEPAHIVLACGIFGNVSPDDVRRTVGALPSLLVEGGYVIWTRGRGEDEKDPSDFVRDCLAGSGFEEVAFTRPADTSYRVGVHRSAATLGPLEAGGRLFSFR